MNNPKFSVGEVVVLQSVNQPQYNGEYTIEKILYNGDAWTDGRVLNEAFAYYLGFISDSGKPLWHESALRKRHTPGEYSFEGLKQILSMPIERRDLA